MTTTTRERPIIFSAPMIRAILAGRKMQTRRVVKPQPDWIRPAVGLDGVAHGYCGSGPTGGIRCPYGVPGDRLWVKEAFVIGYPAEDGYLITTDADGNDIDEQVWYRATEPEFTWLDDDGGMTGKVPWKSPLFMPRWASRITLEITEVRVERVQSISEADVRAEGIEWNEGPFRVGHTNHISAFKSSWDKLNGPRGFPWESNPWVWVLSFRRIEEGGPR